MDPPQIRRPSLRRRRAFVAATDTSLPVSPGVLALAGQNVSLGFTINMPDEL
jgi:hypothetical protein